MTKLIAIDERLIFRKSCDSKIKIEPRLRMLLSPDLLLRNFNTISGSNYKTQSVNMKEDNISIAFQIP